MTEEEKASDKKVKRFDKFLIEILINIIVSVVATVCLLSKLGLIR